LQHHKTVPH